MHLYCFTRGIKHEVDQFINDLQAQYFKFTAPGKEFALVNGNQVNAVQLGVRPIQFWELVFPKESLNDVMATVMMGEGQREFSKKQEILMKTLRATLGASKIPALEPGIARIVRKKNMEVCPVGIKEDGTREEDGSEQL